MSEAPKANNSSKLIYIDQLKVMLTALVILHHAAVTYGASGSWYYSQKSEFAGAVIPMTAFVAVNQAFFMGFFFFLSALFIPSSYSKKGPTKFIADRLLRLGIPLLFYSFVLSPFLSFMNYNYTGTHPKITYMQYLAGFDEWIDFGVMWFVAALLLFTLLYALWRLFLSKKQRLHTLPSTIQILIFAIIIGLITYGVRIIYPVGRVIEPLGFQLGHFPQYISLFILGLIASQSKWLVNTDYKMGRKMLIISLCLIFIGFPLFFVIQKALNFPLEYFTVGGHWQSLWYAIWEQLVGFSLITSLLCIGKSRWNKPSTLLGNLSRTTFAVYIFHPLVLISLSISVHSWSIEPGLKFLIVGTMSVIGTFLLGTLLVKIPRVNRVI